MHRVISLLPGATEIVCALGAADSLVAISHECDYPLAITHLPRVSTSAVDSTASSRDIDASVRRVAESGLPLFALPADDIVRLAPTLIITQSLCEVCAVSDGDVRDIAHLVSPAPTIVPMTGTTLDGAWADIAAIGDALGRAAEAAELLARLAERMRVVHETLKAARAPRPRVAVIEWLDPLFVAGHWTPELVRRAGGVDVVAAPGAHSVQATVDQVRDADPEIVLFAPCGFDVERSKREGRALLASEPWQWARERDVWAIDGNALTSRPGPRLVDALEVMASIFAPALFGASPNHLARRILPVMR
ncbi:MAG: ABC transporter substrate-binding protein [Gemmatimonadota bacterium]|nr:ABC transporter substrate-binding protein [Gemmatimonadota bacterium]